MKIIKSEATFIPCRTWRYSLLRRWAPGDYAMFIGLNSPLYLKADLKPQLWE